MTMTSIKRFKPITLTLGLIRYYIHW